MIQDLEKRKVYFISDGTGITVETLGHSLLTQFNGIEFITHTYRYINSIEKAENIVKEIITENKINKAKSSNYKLPIILGTIANKEIRAVIQEIETFQVDFFDKFINPLEDELKVKATGAMGLSHAVLNYDQYNKRIEAINFALATDDGLNTKDYEKADVILVGISRSGKTPTCIYLAMQFGIKSANFPITEEDFMQYPKLPNEIKKYQNKLFGLTITPDRLHLIRTKRKPDSKYSSMDQCKLEINKVEELYKEFNIKYLNSALRSVEELSTQIISKMGLNPRI